MNLIGLIQQHLLSPHLLFFASGIVAGRLKSDLALPQWLDKCLAIYLMLVIGFRGGCTMAEAGQIDMKMIATMVSGVLVGLLQPFIGYFLLQKTTQLDKPTAAALAAHYGSISMVTFVAAINFLGIKAVPYTGYIVALIALMEAPAVLSGLFIAYQAEPRLAAPNAQTSSWSVRHVVTNNAIMLLMGAFFIGLIAGPKGIQTIETLLVTPFQGILLFFLLNMGLLVAKHTADLKNFSINLLLFGIYMPLINAIIGIGLSMVIGLDKGTGFLFTVLVASASYIVVTAVMRTALPQAKVAIYLPMSLAVTFPFNITLGIPLYFMLAERCLL